MEDEEKTEKEEVEENIENPEKEGNSDEKTEERKKSENKILKGFFIAVISFALLFVVTGIIINSMNKFNYKGVEFTLDKNQMAGKTLYKTSIPVQYSDSKTGKLISTDYNFWLRNDPRELEKKVPVLNGFELRKNVVLDLTTENLFCEGDWNIGFQNTINLFKVLGMNVLIKNETSKYEPTDNYMFITIQIGNSTNLERELATMGLNSSGDVETTNKNTYYLNVNNCEVLPAFEELMVETFVDYNNGLVD